LGIKDAVKIADEILDLWKRAIVRHVDKGHEHVLERLFPKHPDVAFDWIAWRLDGIRTDTRPFYFGLRYDGVLAAAASALSQDQRRKLIGALPRSSSVVDLVRRLVGEDLELFRHLLSRTELEGVRLDPLRLVPAGPIRNLVFMRSVPHWQKMAIAAVEAGSQKRTFSQRLRAVSFGWSGPLSSMFAGAKPPFEKLSQEL